jgi:DNA-binding response OmpR family regulator
MSDENGPEVPEPGRLGSRRRPPGRRPPRHASEFLPGPVIAGSQTQRNEADHTLVIHQRMIRCTPEEYRLLLRLMEEYERPVGFDELIAQCQDASQMDQVLLRGAKRKLVRTLSDLRSKLWPTDFAIVQVMDVGYMLLPQSKLWSLRHADPKEAARSS